MATRDLHAGYGGGQEALRGVDLSITAGETVAVVGPSGSGKSSLLHALAGLLPTSSGEVSIDGVRLAPLSEDERSELRRTKLGIVFQFGELVPELSLLENVSLPLRLVGVRRRPAEARAGELLASLGLGDIGHRRAGQVSGGQAQRAAIARAVIHDPVVVLADEPTGALDSSHAEAVLQLLLDVVATRHTTLILVTHDPAVAARAGRTIRFANGQVSPDDDSAARPQVPLAQT